tara:strand:+ start:3434 stop:3574 length:141 start_codon:yes stop_codon:yes gene_type:complete
MERLTLTVNFLVNHVRQLPAHAATVFLRHLAERLHQVGLQHEVDSI